MKVCQKCNQTYDDANLNFCLNDGEMLTEYETNEAAPTIMLDNVRQTNENWGDFDTNFSDQSQQNRQNQQVYQPPFASPQGTMATANKDQTLPIISLVSGSLGLILSLCCFMGIGLVLGPVAIITGYMGMNNFNKNPEMYDGKVLAIIGMITGGISAALSLIIVLFFILSIIFG